MATRVKIFLRKGKQGYNICLFEDQYCVRSIRIPTYPENLETLAQE